MLGNLFQERKIFQFKWILNNDTMQQLRTQDFSLRVESRVKVKREILEWVGKEKPQREANGNFVVF